MKEIKSKLKVRQNLISVPRNIMAAERNYAKAIYFDLRILFPRRVKTIKLFSHPLLLASILQYLLYSLPPSCHFFFKRDLFVISMRHILLIYLLVLFKVFLIFLLFRSVIFLVCEDFCIFAGL